MTGGLSSALDAWRASIGAEHVLATPDAIAPYEVATYATQRSIPAVLRPATSEQVQACVRIANQHGTPLYAVSGGKNWGLGSRVPCADGTLVLDLARLDRIVAYNEDLGYLTVEPGVTFGQAYDYLAKRNAPYLLNTIGGTPEGSLIGNVVERGHGFGLYRDRFAFVCALEVVLANGELVKTGFHRFDGARAANVHRWGVGPAVDGLFTQSNLGIVTQMTTWLQPRPVVLSNLEVVVRGSKRVPALIDALREVAKDPSLTVAVQNPSRAAALDRERPAERKVATAPETWVAYVRVHALDADEAELRERRVRRLVEPVCDMVTRTDRYDPSKPSETSIATMYRHREIPAAGMDLDRDRCGVVWSCPAVPFLGPDVVAVSELADRMSADRGLPPLDITFLGNHWRSFDAAIALNYDRTSPESDRRALAAMADLDAALNAAGFAPYRLGVHNMGCTPHATGAYDEMVASIKAALDPKGILAPGRYVARSP